jgi:hypothetical protein
MRSTYKQFPEKDGSCRPKQTTLFTSWSWILDRNVISQVFELVENANIYPTKRATRSTNKAARMLKLLTCALLELFGCSEGPSFGLGSARARDEAPGTTSQNDSSMAEAAATSGSRIEESSRSVSSDITSLQRSSASCR